MTQMRITERDLETLSAYLDGQISARGRRQVEARLQVDSVLREAFEHLEYTRAVLRSAPMVRAPRNYVLTPSMVRVKPAVKRIYPVLSFASAMATLLFVLVFLSDSFLSQGTRPVSLLASDAPAGEVVEELLATESVAPMAESVAPDTLRAAPEEGVPTDSGTPEEPALAMELMEATPESTPCADQSADSLCAPIPTGPNLAIPEQAPASQVFEQEPARQIAVARTILRIVEIALVLIAISSGIAALILFRRRNI